MKRRIFASLFTISSSTAAILIAICFIIAYADQSITTTAYSALWFFLLFVITISVLAGVSYLSAWAISKKISKRVNSVDLDNPLRSRLPKEFDILCHRLDAQNKASQKQYLSETEQKDSQSLMRQQFTANISHELKTPLTSVSGYAELIRDGLVDEENISKFAGRIYDESQRMITLVGDIIKLSQFDEKDINIHTEPVKLSELAQKVIKDLESVAQKHKVTVNLSGDDVTINGAEIILEEILHNLIKNAIKYNKEGGKVKVTIRQCLDGVELSVTDTGIGIPKEDLDHVFERFYRVDKSRSKDIGGTGLGLSIVKHGAMFHNASVSIESQPAKGTTVRILF